MAFAENLCNLQSERGETNYRLAKELGVTQTSVQNWRMGVTTPMRVYLEKLADHYGVTVDELLADKADST